MSANVEVVRVFCDDDGGFGNELGIITSGPDTAGREQQIARGLGFSETVFVDDVSEGVATVRIFTPAVELGFAGHPSVGTAWWLAQAGRPVRLLREKAGDVTVRADADDSAMMLIGAQAAWAPEFEWTELASEEALDALDPASFETGHHYFYTWLDEPAGELRSRMFAPSMGVVEDEATGAAAVALTGRLGRDLRIRQGRGSRIVTTHLGDGLVEVGGRTVFDRSIALPRG